MVGALVGAPVALTKARGVPFGRTRGDSANIEVNHLNSWNKNYMQQWMCIFGGEYGLAEYFHRWRKTIQQPASKWRKMRHVDTISPAASSQG